MPAHAQEDLHVIVHDDTGIDRLSKKQVADLFLGRSTGKSGIKVKPVDLKDKAIKSRFYKAVAGMSRHRVRAYWARRVFTGKGRPPASISLEEVPAYMAANRGVITYIPENHVPENTKTVNTLQAKHPGDPSRHRRAQ